MENKQKYPAILFKQRDVAPLQVAFVAPSSEIDSWARVPTKRTGNIRNFQRAEIPTHVQEVQRFFDNPSNASPTGIVVGFDPIRSRGKIIVTDENDQPLENFEIKAGQPTTGFIQVGWVADSDPQTQDEFIEAILADYPTIERYVFEELLDITGVDEESLKRLAETFRETARRGEITSSEDDADGDSQSDDYSSQDRDSDEEQIDSGIEPETDNEYLVSTPEMREELAGLSPSEVQVVVGRLLFLSQFQEDLLRKLPEQALKDLYREVRDEMKPGILIDGQHRIMGTKKLGKIPFLVTALPSADWPELAFQFIVTNRTARRVAESLLISIVGNSLSKEQRTAIDGRLREANIRVGLIEAVMKVHEDEQSPFYNMLAFGLKQEEGFIDAAAMRGKVVQLWYERKSPVRALFDHLCVGRTQSDRTEYWKSEELWFEMFIAFWSAVRERYEGSLVFSSEMLNKAENKPVSRLMTATVLKIFQETVLTYLKEYLKQKQIADDIPLSDSLPNADEFSMLVRRTLEPLTPEFFTDWQLTGFDGSKGARDDLSDAITKVISGARRVSQLKLGKIPHRLYRSEDGQ